MCVCVHIAVRYCAMGAVRSAPDSGQAPFQAVVLPISARNSARVHVTGLCHNLV